MPTLRSVSGGPDIPVDHPLVLVGRHPQCDARLDSDWVSLRHCILTQDGGDVVVRDLGSTNGTWINGWRVERGRLKPGDEVTIAHVRYRLEAAQTFKTTVPIYQDRSEV
jgi:pSer/pThr/pTyr-binding forkhead associated (FHA) protein